jgi:hypothetical protein
MAERHHPKRVHEMTEDEKNAELAFQALNVAALHIQNALGVTTGDLAALFFTGDFEREVCSVFKRYIEAEIRSKRFTEAELLGK